jgi:hypothetical protein
VLYWTPVSHAQEKEDWINAVGRAIVKHSRRCGGHTAGLDSAFRAVQQGDQTQRCGIKGCCNSAPASEQQPSWVDILSQG